VTVTSSALERGPSKATRTSLARAAGLRQLLGEGLEPGPIPLSTSKVAAVNAA
jgi:hypothetical protein